VDQETERVWGILEYRVVGMLAWYGVVPHRTQFQTCSPDLCEKPLAEDRGVGAPWLSHPGRERQVPDIAGCGGESAQTKRPACAQLDGIPRAVLGCSLATMDAGTQAGRKSRRTSTWWCGAAPAFDAHGSGAGTRPCRPSHALLLHRSWMGWGTPGKTSSTLTC
jgi:hypothetical protein